MFIVKYYKSEILEELHPSHHGEVWEQITKIAQALSSETKSYLCI